MIKLKISKLLCICCPHFILAKFMHDENVSHTHDGKKSKRNEIVAVIIHLCMVHVCVYFMCITHLRGTPYAHAIPKLVYSACGYALKWLTLWRISTLYRLPFTLWIQAFVLLFFFGPWFGHHFVGIKHFVCFDAFEFFNFSTNSQFAVFCGLCFSPIRTISIVVFFSSFGYFEKKAFQLFLTFSRHASHKLNSINFLCFNFAPNNSLSFLFAFFSTTRYTNLLRISHSKEISKPTRSLACFTFPFDLDSFGFAANTKGDGNAYSPFPMLKS